MAKRKVNFIKDIINKEPIPATGRAYLYDTREAGHNWKVRNHWASKAEDRADKARLSTLFRENPAAANMLKSQGKKGITEAEYYAYKELNIESISTDDRNDIDPASPSPTPTQKERIRVTSARSYGTEAIASAQYDSSVVLTIPLVGEQGEYPVTSRDVSEWQETYPGIDVAQTLRKCRQWNLDNPKKRKTRHGIRRHINGWLDRAQNRGCAPSGGKSDNAPKGIKIGNYTYI